MVQSFTEDNLKDFELSFTNTRVQIYELDGDIEFAERDCPNLQFDEIQEDDVIDAEMEAEIM